MERVNRSFQIVDNYCRQLETGVPSLPPPRFWSIFSTGQRTPGKAFERLVEMIEGGICGTNRPAGVPISAAGVTATALKSALSGMIGRPTEYLIAQGPAKFPLQINAVHSLNRSEPLFEP
jgi:hypothetical protein